MEKNERGESALRAIYAAQSANFKTLFDFVDGSKTYRNYTRTRSPRTRHPYPRRRHPRPHRLSPR
jgi:hypothetical protein